MTKSEAIQVYTTCAERIEKEDGSLSSVEYNILMLAMQTAGAILENRVKLVPAE